jgi:hypothetical protein
MASYKFYVSTGYINSTREEVVEIPDTELEGMTETEKDDYIYKEYYQDWLNSNADYGWYKTDEDEEE